MSKKHKKDECWMCILYEALFGWVDKFIEWICRDD